MRGGLVWGSFGGTYLDDGLEGGGVCQLDIYGVAFRKLYAGARGGDGFEEAGVGWKGGEVEELTLVSLHVVCLWKGARCTFARTAAGGAAMSMLALRDMVVGGDIEE